MAHTLGRIPVTRNTRTPSGQGLTLGVSFHSIGHFHLQQRPKGSNTRNTPSLAPLLTRKKLGDRFQARLLRGAPATPVTHPPWLLLLTRKKLGDRFQARLLRRAPATPVPFGDFYMQLYQKEITPVTHPPWLLFRLGRNREIDSKQGF